MQQGRLMVQHALHWQERGQDGKLLEAWGQAAEAAGFTQVCPGATLCLQCRALLWMHCREMHKAGRHSYC